MPSLSDLARQLLDAATADATSDNLLRADLEVARSNEVALRAEIARLQAIIDAEEPPVEPEPPVTPPTEDPNPGPWSGTGTVVTGPVLTAAGKRVLTAYPGNAQGPRPLVLVGHGRGMDPAAALQGHQFLVKAGYVVAVPDLGASSDFNGLAKQVVAATQAVLQGSLKDKVAANRIGYTGGSQGGITGLALVDDANGAKGLFDCLVIKCGAAYTSGQEWASAPPLLFIHGTADSTVKYADGQAAYAKATKPKGMISLAGVGHDLNAGDNIIQEATLGLYDRFLLGKGAGAIDRIAQAAKKNTKATYVSDWTLD